MRNFHSKVSTTGVLAATVGKRIRLYRTERNMSPRDVAALLAMPVDWIQDYEAGRRLARTYTLYQLARLFGVNVGSLVDDEPGEEPVTDVLLLRALRRLQKLDATDRQAVAEFLDGFTTGLTKLRNIRTRRR